MNTEEFRVHGKEMVDYICDYVKTLPNRQVSPKVSPNFLKLPESAPSKPESYYEVMKDCDEKIMPGMVHWGHPNFFAYFGNGASYPSIIGDMLSDGIPTVGFSWASSPAMTELEGIMIDWLTKAMDLPPEFLSNRSNPDSCGGGAIQGSASEATFVCMNAARYQALKVLRGDDCETHESFYLPRLVAYASSEAHSSVEKAARMNLVRLHVLKPDEHDVLRGDSLERAINEDLKRGLIPFFVCATAGTTNQVAFDNLYEIGQVALKHPLLWFHVDGAYGGNSFILPEMEPFKRGMEFVDSFIINPNKLLLTAFDCTCLFLRNVADFIEAFVINPLYLEHQFDQSVVDLRHFGTPLSRRFRSLKLYFTFRLYGREKLQEYVRQVIKFGKMFEELVRADERFEVLNDVHLGLVCFRVKESNKVNDEILKALNDSGRIHLTRALVKGKKVIRFVANQEFITEEQIKGAWETIQEIVTKYLDSLKK